MPKESDVETASVPEEAPVTDLIRDALGDTRELVRIEVALAREDLRSEIAAAKVSAAASVGAGIALVVALALFTVAVVLALEAGWAGALVAGGIWLVLGVALGLIGWKGMPRKPMVETRERLLADVEQLRERIA
jgi:hypothetical protein